MNVNMLHLKYFRYAPKFMLLWAKVFGIYLGKVDVKQTKTIAIPIQTFEEFFITIAEQKETS